MPGTLFNFSLNLGLNNEYLTVNTIYELFWRSLPLVLLPIVCHKLINCICILSYSFIDFFRGFLLLKDFCFYNIDLIDFVKQLSSSHVL